MTPHDQPPLITAARVGHAGKRGGPLRRALRYARRARNFADRRARIGRYLVRIGA